MPLHDDLIVEVIATGPFVENCYLVGDRRTAEAMVVDPGDEASAILARLKRLGLKATRIVNTHGHIDHVGAVADLRRELGVPFLIHPADRPILASLPLACELFGLPPKEIPEIDGELGAEMTLALGELRVEVRPTPGHTPGGVCLYLASAQVVFTGDTLFAGAIGRTDLPGGNTAQLLASIRAQLLTLPDDVVVYPGHGPSTTIGHERRGNPFLMVS